MITLTCLFIKIYEHIAGKENRQVTQRHDTYQNNLLVPHKTKLSETEIVQSYCILEQSII